MNDGYGIFFSQSERDFYVIISVLLFQIEIGHDTGTKVMDNMLNDKFLYAVCMDHILDIYMVDEDDMSEIEEKQCCCFVNMTPRFICHYIWDIWW